MEQSLDLLVNQALRLLCNFEIFISVVKAIWKPLLKK
nr:MAG TPA: hypothetical protein [Caudoviricetes sp.]